MKYLILMLALVGCAQARDMSDQLKGMAKSASNLEKSMNESNKSIQDMDQRMNEMSGYTQKLVALMEKIAEALGGGHSPIPLPSPAPTTEQPPVNQGIEIQPAIEPIAEREPANTPTQPSEINLDQKTLPELQALDSEIKTAIQMKLVLEGSIPHLITLFKTLNIKQPDQSLPPQNQALIVEIASLLKQL